MARLEAVLGPQSTSTFVLTYTPEDLSVSKGELTIESDDPAKMHLAVPVIGKGTDNQCPQAVAEASLSGANRYGAAVNTIPLKTVQFRGTNSIDPDGTVARYEWNVIQRPSGSTAQLSPSSTVAEPSLFIDLAGDYVVELTSSWSGTPRPTPTRPTATAPTSTSTSCTRTASGTSRRTTCTG